MSSRVNAWGGGGEQVQGSDPVSRCVEPKAEHRADGGLTQNLPGPAGPPRFAVEVGHRDELLVEDRRHAGTFVVFELDLVDAVDQVAGGRLGLGPSASPGDGDRSVLGMRDGVHGQADRQVHRRLRAGFVLQATSYLGDVPRQGLGIHLRAPHRSGLVGLPSSAAASPDCSWRAARA